MAQVFLSYDREDGAKARVIAQALERAGHFVWWDMHIKGGAEYGREIEAALDQADAVVVLWSERSVQSAWVRDEAAAGRDKGALIPVLLEPVNPPMGFRQYQSLDFGGWKGRGKPPRMTELLDSIAAISCASKGPISPTPVKTSAGIPPASGVLKWLKIAAVIMAILIALSLVLPGRSGSTAASTVVIVPADDGRASQSLAESLLVQLGEMNSGDAASLQLLESASNSKPDYTFKIGASSNDGHAQARLALIAAKSGALIWSRQFEQPDGRQGDLRQQVAFTAGRVLQCAADTEGKGAGKLSPETLKLYLSGCAELHSIWGDDPRRLIAVFKQVVDQAPRFERGWANLLSAESEVLSNPDNQNSGIAPELRDHIAAARKLNPELAEAYIAEAWLLPPRPIMGRMRLLERAVERNPNHPVALMERGRAYMHVGRTMESIADARRATQLDPLSPATRDALVTALAYAGQLDAAMTELEEAERIWPGATNLLAARYRIQLRYGDAQEALRIHQSGALSSPAGPTQELFLRARIDRDPEKVKRVLDGARSVFARFPEAVANTSQVIAEFGTIDELISILMRLRQPKEFDGAADVIFRPAFGKLHRDPRFMTVARHLGLLDYWRESGKWPDFCFAPDLPYDCKAEAAKLN